MLGFGGHWSTKSRRYSTTMTVLRRDRVAFARRRRARDGVPLDAWGRPEDDQAVVVVASWLYAGAGSETEGERWLALSAAARAREQRPIAREELTAAGLDRDVWQFPVVLLADVRSVGVQGDGRTYGHPIVLRPVSSEDAMTADWARLPYDVLAKISTRITNEVEEVNRVTLDVTSKPPGTIEWE